MIVKPGIFKPPLDYVFHYCDLAGALVTYWPVLVLGSSGIHCVPYTIVHYCVPYLRFGGFLVPNLRAIPDPVSQIGVLADPGSHALNVFYPKLSLAIVPTICNSIHI